MFKMMFRVSTIGIMFLAILGIMTLLGSPIWWLALPMSVCAYMIVTLVLKKLFKTALLAPFKMKGSVLHHAQVTVHSIKISEPPSFDGDDEDDDEDDEDDEPRLYYQVDLTITPTSPPKSMTYWEPSELILVPKAVNSDAEIWDELEEAGYVETVEVFDGEQFVPDEDYKYTGTQRVRLLMSVQANCRQGRLQYYFEDIGGLELPLPEAEPVTI